MRRAVRGGGRRAHGGEAEELAGRAITCHGMPNSAYFSVSDAPAASSLKPIQWMGSSREDLRALPEEPRRRFGYGLHQA